MTFSYTYNGLTSLAEFKTSLERVINAKLTPVPGVGQAAYEFGSYTGAINVAATNDRYTISVNVVATQISPAVIRDLAKVAIGAGGH